MTSFIEQQVQRMEDRRRQLEQSASTGPTATNQLDYSTTIKKWWNSMAPSVRQHPWSLETIMTSAFPGQSPAPRFVAAVLREEMGFSEHRDWTVAGRNRRQWIPPAVTK